MTELIQDCHSALRILMHSMYTDTTLNSRATVLSTLYLNFVDTAMKVHRYIKTLGSSIELNGSLIISKWLSLVSCIVEPKRSDLTCGEETIDDVMNLAFMLAKSEHKKSNAPDYTCTINKTQVKWYVAFWCGLAVGFKYQPRRIFDRYVLISNPVNAG